MRVYLKMNPGTFYPDPIVNDTALGFFEERRRNKHNNKENNKMSGDMGSVLDRKIGIGVTTRNSADHLSLPLRVRVTHAFSDGCCCCNNKY